MKKNSFLKIMAGLLVLFVIGSWIIPTGYYSSAVFTEDVVNAFGIVDFIKYPIIALTSSVFVLYGLVFLSIGAFYGVINKTGAYQTVIEKIVKKFNKNSKIFLIGTVLTFSILESLTALTLPLFILVPAAGAVLIKLGYSKKTAFISTVGALLIGNLASTYGFNVNGYLSYFYGTSINANIIFKIVFFVLTIGLLLLYLLKFNKEKVNTKKAAKEEVIIPLYEETKLKKVNTKPFIIVMILMIVLSLVGMYNWFNTFGIDFFNNIYETVTTFEVGTMALFGNLLGAIDPIGYWTNYDLVGIILLSTIVIAKLYKLSIKDMLSSALAGIKEMLPVAVMVILANLIFLLVNASTYSFYPTIHNSIVGLSDNLNFVTVGLSTLFGGLLYNDFPYMVNSVYTNLASATNLNLMMFVQQTIHGFVSLIAPTSFVLIAGLTYFKVDYKEYLKTFFKALLLLFVFVVVMITILAFL